MDLGALSLVQEDSKRANRYGMLVHHHILLQILWAKKSLTLHEINDVFYKVIQKYQGTYTHTFKMQKFEQ